MKTDAQIQADVIQELKWNPSVNHERIGVAVDDGIVTLSGRVPSYLQRSLAEMAAQSVAGVKAVVEKVEVDLPDILKRTDEDIARAAHSALKWNIQVPEEAIKISVKDGTIELKGEVEWNFQRKAAQDAVKSIIGVSGVNNFVTIKSKISPVDVKEKIEDALKRAVEREARRINVDVQGSKVILSGKVRSLADLRDAKGAAWNAPGVTDVENNLRLAA